MPDVTHPGPWALPAWPARPCPAVLGPAQPMSPGWGLSTLPQARGIPSGEWVTLFPSSRAAEATLQQDPAPKLPSVRGKPLSPGDLLAGHLVNGHWSAVILHCPHVLVPLPDSARSHSHPKDGHLLFTPYGPPCM